MNSLIEIGLQARQQRKKMGDSNLAELAQKLKISKNAISEIERGIFRGNLTTFIQYLSYLGLSLRVVHQQSPTLDNLSEYFNDD